jgi:hypothetical protein
MFDGRQCENGNNKASFFISIKNIGIFEEKGNKKQLRVKNVE